jgi:signal transduction histidine kinase
MYLVHWKPGAPPSAEVPLTTRKSPVSITEDGTETMHDVLIHYLEVNFDEIAEQLAHAAGATDGQQAPSTERLRQVIRELHRAARRPPGDGWAHAPGKAPEPARTLTEMMDAAGVELDPVEREVLSRYFELFIRSMERTQPAPPLATRTPAAASAAIAPPAQAPAATVLRPLDQIPQVAREPEPELEPELEEERELPAAAGLVPEETPLPLQTILMAAAQQAIDLLQVDASHVYTRIDGSKFLLRVAVPADSGLGPDPIAPFESRLLSGALEQNEVLSIEDLASERLGSGEQAWLQAGFHGLVTIALAPPLDRPVGVLVLLRRTRWRLDRRDAVKLEDLAVEAATALRPQSLAAKVEEVAVMQERIKLAREIHDGLASDLAAVVALFKYYEQRRARDPQDAAELLQQIRGATEEVLQGARNILQELRPGTIRSEGLLAAVLKHVDQFGRLHMVETIVNIRGDENGLSPEQKEGIFQVLRESLSNIRKHAEARNVWVSLDMTGTPWVLSVRDDGRGFDVGRAAEDPKPGSYGLLGMHERANLLDATLEILSNPGEGTIVRFIGPSDGAP